MIDVEAIQFAVGRQVDAGLALDVEDHARRVEARLLARERDEPFGNRIRADGGGANAGERHGNDE